MRATRARLAIAVSVLIAVEVAGGRPLFGSADQGASGAAPQAGPIDAKTLAARCQSGDQPACRELLPKVQAECDKKNASACSNLGWMYETGHGVDSDPVRAAVFFTQACDLGERRGCVSFAVLQAQGRGVPLDVEAARATFESACKDGFFDACTSLAVMLASGPKPDLVRARELLTRSCDGKFAPACELLKSLPPPAQKPPLVTQRDHPQITRMPQIQRLSQESTYDPRWYQIIRRGAPATPAPVIGKASRE